VLREPDGGAAMREHRRHRHGGEVLEMFNPNWISAATARHLASVLSRSRADFGVEASSRSPHFCRAVNATAKGYTMSLQTTLGPGAAATRQPRRNPAHRRVIALLRRWRERPRTSPQLCELDDHILRDIGLTRDALLRKQPGRSGGNGFIPVSW
jgi:uncharacterized protein YjiS (DUF1127 family)